MGLNVELLEKSFNVIMPRGQEFSQAFYKRLFQDFPETKDMFTQDNSMSLLKSLMYIIGRVKAGQMQELTIYLKQLGQRHNDYRVEPTDYPKVGAVLLATLKEYSGDVWDDQVEQAWADAFDVIQTVMQQGAREGATVQ